MKPLCVIPARRGSKRLPLKNILPLAGRPMLTHTIDAALSANVFDDVYVSTEDGEIAELASRAGATVHKRSDVLAGDLVSATDVCIDVADSVDPNAQRYGAIVCLQPTSPLRNAADIRGSWVHFVETKASYLVSVTPIDPHYFHWAVHRAQDGWAMYFGTQFLKERPLLPPVYRPNGAIKIGRVRELKDTRNFFGKGLEVFQMPEERSVHVAELFDLKLAEFLFTSSPHNRDPQ
jgi:CMP-N,N'-diacetyllegionaminic acid synthase